MPVTGDAPRAKDDGALLAWMVLLIGAGCVDSLCCVLGWLL